MWILLLLLTRAKEVLWYFLVIVAVFEVFKVCNISQLTERDININSSDPKISPRQQNKSLTSCFIVFGSLNKYTEVEVEH